MSLRNPSTNGTKITVKLTKRIPITPRDDLLTRNLNEVYEQCLQILSTKNYHDKRFTTKMTFMQNGLQLNKGSWWFNEPNDSLLPYKNVLQFSSFHGRPAKILLIITNEARNKTELVVVKTRGPNYANLLMEALKRNVDRAHNSLVQNVKSPGNGKPRPVSYQPGVGGTDSSMVRSPAVTSPTGQQRRRPAPPPPSTPIEKSPDSGKQQMTALPQPREIPKRVKKVSSQNNNNVQNESPSPSNGVYEGSYSKTSYDPETKVETLDSVTYYGHPADKPVKSTSDNSKQKKSKSRASRELSTLSTGGKVTRELDENNTPWEVNICYIKHDPLVGCVEDESGPIYMYTAHQLLPREDNDYDDGSEDSDGESWSEDGESDDSSSSGSQGSLDQNRELERFMMVRGNNYANNGTNKSGDPRNEVYEY